LLPAMGYPHGVTALIIAATAGLFLWWFAHRHNLPRDPVTARVWRPSHADFVFPEVDPLYGIKGYLESKKDFGIAFGGGGSRGMAIAHGAARAFWEAGFLQKARYMSTSSGSIWFGIPFEFQKLNNISEFLGTSLPPSNLTEQVLNGERMGSMIWRLQFPKFHKSSHSTKAASWLQSISSNSSAELAERRRAEIEWDLDHGLLDKAITCFRDLCSCVVQELIPNTSLQNLWQLVVSFYFLRPFGLTSRDSAYTQSSEEARVRAQIGKDPQIFTSRNIQQDKLPFLLSQAALLATHTGTSAVHNPIRTFPVELTPLYIGIVPSITGPEAEPYGGVGDLLVEPFASSGFPVEPLPYTAMADAHIRQSRLFFNLGGLAEWSGVGTAFPADFQVSKAWIDHVRANLSFCTYTAVEKLLPHKSYWSPLHVNKNNLPVSRWVPVGDAGIYDDIGHIPLLRRNISNMVIFDSSGVHGDLMEMTYLLAAFGQPNPAFQSPPGALSPTMEKDFLTVFEPSEFPALWADIQRLHAAREPIVVRGTYTTVTNAHFAISGGRKVHIVWAIEMRVDEWTKLLPASTKRQLPAYFPSYSAAEARTQFQLSALSQFSSWFTTQAVLKEVNAMLKQDDKVVPLGNRLETVVV